ncbi:ABC transporter permease [Rudaeicoccus suwonensis]|uniref:ABC-2 type transport system permease protein n=1 Tax=Rudaeicoccus suwonensis TaxID=657409 RepID=A0A561E0S4_9MICO|nr:ABC transporter permease [Rudaeicoccus suwonensis]TWE09191.1 ABC-2 type transport system permease protein [Rudaeicoccus suwonensis]
MPILRLGLRSLFLRARVVLLIALPIVLLLLSAVVRFATQGSHADAAADLISVFGIGLVVPIVTLIATTTLINSEFDDGSIIYLLTKPIPRLTIIASKAVVVLASVLVVAAIPIGIAGLVVAGTSDGVAVAGLLGAVVSGAAYVGIFTALATFMKRSILGCLLYWLLWESTISSLISPVKWLSARSWGTAVLDGVASVPGRHPGVPVLYAVAATLIALVIGIVLAGRRLAAMTLSEV